ncbi:Glutamine amidotransferase class-I [Desulfurella amilsii]|uniref:Glutamine amidotransferase class-I n=1 Tax=Desulfurella amilsii TaxID=1562698 RepID=A0A1X4XVU2_9BACT|nr:gamma-glutamyl-gamma-aminobutyrate hydrolase family protein [Desulfurella amilsii]OSS41650.1 Glutamine amidotransferase class-I [Desulfurella amilsii]
MSKALAIRHVKIEHAGLLGEVLYNMGCQIHYLDTPKGQLLEEPLENYSLVVVLGGYMGAYEEDKYPFLNYEFKIMEYALKADIPLIGICLGSQMLARVLGSRVYKGNKKEIGFFEVKKVEKHPYFDNFPDSFKVFQWHNDTFDLPEGAVRVFTSDTYQNQGFVYNKAVGLQFHIEVDENMIKEWLLEYSDEINKEGINISDILKDASVQTQILKNYTQGFGLLTKIAQGNKIL